MCAIPTAITIVRIDFNTRVLCALNTRPFVKVGRVRIRKPTTLGFEAGDLVKGFSNLLSKEWCFSHGIKGRQPTSTMQHLPTLLVVCVVCTSRKKGPDRYIHPVGTNLPCGKSTLSREGILNFYGRRSSRSSAETQRGHGQRGRKGLIARTAGVEGKETQGSTCLLYAILLNGSKEFVVFVRGTGSELT